MRISRKRKGGRRLKFQRAAGRERSSINSEMSLRLALEAADMVTWIWDLRTDLIHYSKNVQARISGKNIRPYKTMAGLLETVHPDDRDVVAQALARAKQEGVPFECEYRMCILNEEYRWILAKGSTVIMEDGGPVCILGLSQDLTARKKVEEELHRRSRQLAELAAELIMVEHHERQRLADLVGVQLHRLLAAARQRVNTMTATEQGRKRRQLKILCHTLGDTLALVQSITRSLAPPAHPLEDFKVAFGWLAQDLRQRYQLAVTVTVDPDYADSDQVKNVLLFTAARELLQNVGKHAGTQKASLHLRRQSLAVVLEVSDQGKGFDPALLQHSNAHQGFGLFSIRERAELLGGTLTGDSAPGHGTRVILSLPIINVKR